jgi:hypothetical protein
MLRERVVVDVDVFFFNELLDNLRRFPIEPARLLVRTRSTLWQSPVTHPSPPHEPPACILTRSKTSPTSIDVFLVAPANAVIPSQTDLEKVWICAAVRTARDRLAPS